MFSKPNNQGDLLFFRFIIEYENVGNTPALNAEMILGLESQKPETKAPFRPGKPDKDREYPPP